jgi:homoserine O-acetyltransferase
MVSPLKSTVTCLPNLCGLFRATSLLIVLLSVVSLASAANGEPLPVVEKKAFEISAFRTVGGEVIPKVRLGYETYGKLNASGDNAIFISHFYSGSSHAAGRYTPEDAAPGYWDAIIGPGKPIDTDKYFVISADTFANLNVGDPRVITTGPASIDPATGKPYGMRFPVVSLRDSVRAHRSLLDKLGVKRLVAVAGASGGAIQAMEWAALYPDYVSRVIHVIGPGFDISPWAIALVDLWTTPIRLDPAWNGGDYYGTHGPTAGLAKALKVLTLTARHWEWTADTFGYSTSRRLPDPAKSIEGQFQAVDALDQLGQQRASVLDANHMIYMSRAAALYRLSETEIRSIKANILFVPASSDLIFPPKFSEEALKKFRANGGRAELFTLQGKGGHLDGLLEISQAAETIRQFIESP